jgi:preprotein translocase subunit SecA
MLKKLFRKISFRNRYKKLIHEINSLESDLKTLTDNELRSKSFQLQKQYQSEQDLKSLISQAFALTREASLRTLGLRHFDVQLLGGLVLNNQKIAEMKTGEGKTLVSTLPSFLNAIPKKGVHIVTVNDYLANRDQVSMGQIYRFLGMDTGLIQEGMTPAQRRENYNADITYVTNYQVAFDFLRDNSTLDVNEIVLRPFNYCIIDEVDSILIDEAQTPLILSRNIPTVVENYIAASEIVSYLKPNRDYTVDEKNRNVILTEFGNEIIEKILMIRSLYDSKNPWISYILNALKANFLYFLNVHYIIQNNRIIIIDEFTGRIMPDRRWGDGLHQAIEAKENLPIRQNTETVAAITYQNFFLLYNKLSGMTGTGKTAETEFQKIYKLSVSKVPTAKPTQRKDLPDLIYKDQFSKWNAIAEACYKISLTGQPILIGTKTVEKSEMLAQLLSEYKLSYRILNAKPENVRREAEIVAQAGQKNSITIATNMAGRGTDIILGGNINFTTQKKLYDILTFVKNYPPSQNILESSFLSQLQGSSQKCISILISLLQDQSFLKLSDLDILRNLRDNDRISIPVTFYQCSIRALIQDLTYYHKKEQKQQNQIVKNLGGLYIIGTERNDSRRIDNQLRGRCGRQGDPGTSRFFLSLDDTLLRLFGGLKIQNFIKNQMDDDSPLESKLLTKSLDSAQKKIEERAYEQRKNLFDYDDVLNKQRNIIYQERRKILNTISVKKEIFAQAEQLMAEIAVELKKEKFRVDKTLAFVEEMLGKPLALRSLPVSTRELLIQFCDLYDLKSYLFDEFWLAYQAKATEVNLQGKEIFEDFQREIILKSIDTIWQEHLQKTTLLREAVGWRGYGQRNPLDEYKKEAFDLFEQREKVLRQLVIYDLLRSSVL